MILWLLWGTIFVGLVYDEAQGNEISVARRRNCFFVMMSYMLVSLLVTIGVILNVS
jgi:hypothetical protein